MGNKVLTAIFVITTLVFAYLYYKESSKFPITRYVCSLGYVDCFPVGKHDTRDSCEYANTMSNWRCDSTDKSNIRCTDPSDSFAVGYCK